MIRRFIRDTIADLTNAVARSELTAENARMRAELASERNRSKEFGAELDEAFEERDDLRAKLEAAERRGQVDRSAAIEAVLAKLGFMSRDEACEAVDAVLGSAKTGSEKLTTAPTEIDKKGVRQAMELAARNFGGTDGMFNLAQFSHALMEVSGLRGAVDGLLCRTILADRDDVESCEPVNLKCAHYRIRPPSFTPALTGEYASPEVLARIRTLISASSSPTDAAPRIYALIASDYAAAVKRVGELEAENRRLVGELNQAKADRDTAARLSEHDSAEVARLSAPCPADGMSDEAIGGILLATSGGYGVVWERHKRVGAAARALFGRPAR